MSIFKWITWKCCHSWIIYCRLIYILFIYIYIYFMYFCLYILLLPTVIQWYVIHYIYIWYIYVYISHVGVSTVDPIHGLTLAIAYWYIGPHVEGLLYLLLIYLNTKHMIRYEIIWLFLWYLDQGLASYC